MARPLTQRTIPRTSKLPPKAFLFSLPRVTAARLVATTVSARPRTESAPTPSRPHRITSRSGARTSTIPIRARTAFTGTLRTLPRSARQLLISRQFRGIIRAPAPCSQRILALSQRTAQTVLATTLPLDYRFKQPWRRDRRRNLVGHRPHPF